MWSQFHQIRCDDVFKEKWKSFLLSSKLIHSPIFYQAITTRVLDFILKDSCPIYSEPPSDTSNSEDVPPLTYEEENTIRYIGGYIIRSLKKKKEDDEDVIVALNDLVDDKCDEEAEESEEWLGMIDRGGLIYINNATFQFLKSIEYTLRMDTMNIEKAHTMDDACRSKMRKAVESDDDVQFNWMLVAVDMDDEIEEKVFDLIVDKWITIRGFSFANSMLEMYKRQAKQGTQKSKRLRHDV